VFINDAKESGLRPGQVEVDDPYNRKFVELYAMYDAQCQREGVVDFAELLLRCYELLLRNEPVRAHYQERFRHILVDEFQDTNTLQYKWLKLLRDGRQAAGPTPPPTTRSSPSATTTSRSTPSAAPTSATWPTSSASSGSAT